MKKWMYRTIAGVLLGVLLTGTLAGVFGMEAQAAEKSDYDKDDFTIETELSLSQDGETYDIHIEITNEGKDFEGTVRVIAENDYSRTCAYDTALSLSEGSTKQFTVSIPMSSLNSNSSTRGLYVILLDQKGITITEKYYRRFFEDYVNHVSIGILSNDYLALDYLDLNGDTAFIINDNYPLELVELTKDTVEEQLAELDYLVIDQYDTSVLPAGTIAAIEKWTKQGGMLIFGTGTYAYEVLSGFDQDFLQTRCLGICHPDTGFESEYKGDMYSVTGATSLYDYYGISLDMYLSMDNFTDSTYNNGSPDTAVVDTAILENFSQNSGMYHYGYGYGSTIPAEDGSITYMYYALSDPDIASACAYEPYVTENMLEMASDTARIDYAFFHRTTENGVKYGSYFEEALGIIDLEKSSLNFTVLKVIIVIYVGLVGPGIYLILRALKKRELYWVAVPVLAFLFVGIVSLAGRGFRVADMTVCSVTFVDAGGSGKTGTVFSAYSADHDDWQIKMTENCAYAGPMQSSYGYGSDPLEYYYQVSDDISGLSVGLRPDASFETAMFQGRMSEPTGGELVVEGMAVDACYYDLQGKVTNRTGYDFPYMAVLQQDHFYVVEDVKDGETVDLSQMEIMTRTGSLSSLDEIFWSKVENYYDDGEKETAAMLSAMYIGLVQAGEYTDTVVIGVTPDYERVTEGNYAETSYGCFYSCIQ
ncbi:MAG: hypothetical protein ACI4DW_00905 [Lachnospiraceae bacterium]